MTAEATPKVSIMNAVLIWLLTNMFGTAIMSGVVIITNEGEAGFVLLAGLIGTVITLPAIGMVFGVLYMVSRISSIEGRVVVVILSMIMIALLVGTALSIWFGGGLGLYQAGGLVAIFSPWILSAIGTTLLIERRNIFRKRTIQ